MSFTTRRNSVVVASAKAPFCKVCYDAGLSTHEFTSHFVKDQPGPNGKVVCPTLLAQKCLICGVPGHTSSYCPDNSSVSSSSTVQGRSHFTPAMATDEVRHPPPPHSNSIRLPPITIEREKQQHKHHAAPRIVYANELETNPIKPIAFTRNEFPSLPNLSSLRRFENDEPKLQREMQLEASPVHSPATPSPKKWKKVKYNKKTNPFGVLDNSNVDSDVDSEHSPLPVIKKQEKASSSSSSWASIAAASNNKSSVAVSKQLQQQSQQQQQRTRSRFSIVVPTAISVGPLLPPLSFKPKPANASDIEKKQQVKKMWGDTDSEDDEEFLKRGLN